MKTNETSLKASARLNRIKVASRIFRVLIGLFLCWVTLAALACFFGWLGFLPRGFTITMSLSPHQQYDWPFVMMPNEVLALALVRFGLFAFCVLILNQLFQLFERGIFFSAKHVYYTRFLGYYVMIDWLVTYLLESRAHEMRIEFTQPLIGVLIIFIAWIMDEGRKIQEEQELTV